MMTKQDITFIGSGVAASFTLLNVLKQHQLSLPQTLLKITIIEKSDEFHTGLAYGYRSGSATLLIKPLSLFIRKTALDQFVDWLNHNKIALLEDFKKNGGPLTTKWFENNRTAIANNDWEHLHIPRSFFGKYIKEIVSNKIDDLTSIGRLKIEFIKDEVINVKKTNCAYNIHLKNSTTVLFSTQVVLGIGSPPLQKIFSSKDSILAKKHHILLIENPYESSLSKNGRSIRKFMATQRKESYNVLIIGSNASAIEMVYQLNDDPKIKSKINTLYTLSTLNKFPNAIAEKDTKISFIPKHLLQLQQQQQITACEISNAVQNDIKDAERQSIDIRYTIAPIGKTFPYLLPKLNSKEKKIFACHTGNHIGKQQREAGLHYSEIIRELSNQNKLHMIAGKFLNITEAAEKASIAYTTAKAHLEKKIPYTIDIIINCTGSSTIDAAQNANSLLHHLIENKICTINDSKKGILVNDTFESHKNFYVIGPLLSGNVIVTQPVWHVEHCGRIERFANTLGSILYDKYNKSNLILDEIPSTDVHQE